MATAPSDQLGLRLARKGRAGISPLPAPPCGYYFAPAATLPDFAMISSAMLRGTSS